MTDAATMPSTFARSLQEDEASVLRFNEQELNEILGIIESRGADLPFQSVTSPGGHGEGDPQSDLGGLGFLQLENASMHLQFHPRSPGSELVDPVSISSIENNCCSPSLEPYLPATSEQQQQQEQQANQSHMSSQGQFMVQQRSSSSTAMLAAYPYAQNLMYPGFPAFAGAAQSVATAMQQASPRPQKLEKPQVSHSTVEKQRRDRINSLIDELRDLVPPQKGTIPCPAAAKMDASAEARRPKHVVLADTIALVKQWRLNASAMAQPGSYAPPCMQAPLKTDPESGSASGDTEMQRGNSAEMAAAHMPNIPMSLNSFAGVTVEKTAESGVMYVQVKCRDRRGLLSDIINSLKLLPLEIRSAAVVTSGDGMVRDVFEVRSYDSDLQAETVQNMVHDGLYNQYFGKPDEGCGKRQKS